MQLNDDFIWGFVTAGLLGLLLLTVSSISSCRETDLVDYPKEQDICVIVYTNKVAPEDKYIDTCYPMPQTE